MPYTFGAGTGDDATWTNSNSGFTAGITVVTGWWRPTTLTAGRGLWSAGSIIGAEIDTTTTELRLKLDNATTDGEWTTSGLGLAVDTWRFLAFASSTVNTPGASWKVWAGTVETAPVEVTVNVAVALSGAFTGTSSFTVGNKGSAGVVAFQGDIAEVLVVGETASNTNSMFSNESFGSFTSNITSQIERQMVFPAWEGDYDSIARLRNGNTAVMGLYGYWSGESTTVETPFGRVVATISGATVSQNGSPRPRPSGRPLDHGSWRRSR